MKHLRFWIKLLSLLLLWGLLLPRMVHAQPGTPDPTFGAGQGFVHISYQSDAHASSRQVVCTPDSRILLIGDTWVPNGDGNSKIAIAKFLSNGAPDPTFGNGSGKVAFSFPDYSLGGSSLLILPDGKYLCTGFAYEMSTGMHHTYLCRINPDGSLDNSFDGDGIRIYPGSTLDRGFYSLCLQPDGKILAAGNFNYTGYDELTVARFSADGTPDPAFGGGDGLVSLPLGESYSYAYSTLVQPDGKILLAGTGVVNGWDAFAVVRLKPNGDLDPSFSGDGKDILHFSTHSDIAKKVLLQSGGKIVVAGYSDQGPGSDVKVAAVRYNANGVLDNSFGDGNGIATINVGSLTDYCQDAVLQPDGKILLGGSTPTQPFSGYQLLMIRLSADGKKDPDFGTDGVAVFNTKSNGAFIYGITLQPNGKVLGTGPVRIGDYDAFGLMRMETGITVDTQTPFVDPISMRLYPNPVVDHATLEYELSQEQPVKIDLYDAEGRLIANLSPSTTQTAGPHKVLLNMPFEIPQGVYTIHLETEHGKTAIEAIF